MAMTGTCLCGSVAVTLAKPVRAVDACHCGMCRTLSGGGPHFGLHQEGGAKPAIADETTLTVYRSSEWAERAFCRTCGTPVYYRFIEGEFYSISSGLFDPAELELGMQIFIDDKPGFYELANDTRKLTGEETVALFAGADAEAKA